jgi:trk system potassium uptake protein TrkA
MTRGVVGDATDPDMLRRVGASDADAAVISTGEDLAATIMSVLALRDVGVKRIYAKVASLRAARALARFEVDEMIFPEKDSAERLSRRITSTTVLDYVSLGQDHAIQEMAIPDAWVGKTLRELALPRERGIQVVALFNVLETSWDVVPDPDEPLTESHVAIVAGEEKVLAELIREVDRGRT